MIEASSSHSRRAWDVQAQCIAKAVGGETTPEVGTQEAATPVIVGAEEVMVVAAMVVAAMVVAAMVVGEMVVVEMAVVAMAVAAMAAEVAISLW